MCTHPAPSKVKNEPGPGVVVARVWEWGGFKEEFSEEEGSQVPLEEKIA